MLITDEYRRLNQELHARGVGFGAKGSRWADLVAELVQRYHSLSVLDYGCGLGTLKVALEKISAVHVHNYDPAIPEYAEDPPICDIVVCTDVIEHIEPTCLHDVLRNISDKMTMVALLNIATQPAKKRLADGRNAHLLVRPPYFWFETLKEYFDIANFSAGPGDVMFLCYPHGTFYRD